MAWEEGEETERLSPELETTIYRCVQEALNNVSRHASADRVHVRVTEDEGEIWVEVVDDGVGFDPGTRAEGVGLVGMRERVALVGGRLELESGSDGTVLRARMPARHDRR
jgi:signal transduction histidine kinase